MPFSLLPSTPPGTPALRPTEARLTSGRAPLRMLRAVVGAAIRTIGEPLDRWGVAAVGAFTCSALSATASYVAWRLALAGFHQYYAPIASVVHFAGDALWGIAAGAGLMSERRLPRLMAWTVVLEAALFYGWDRLHLPGSFHPWNLILHIVLGAVLAGPSLVAHAWRWLGRHGHDGMNGRES